jgi:hypothetical protein
LHHLGNRFIGLSASGEFPGAGVLTATGVLEATSSGLQFSSAKTWLSCESPPSKEASAIWNFFTHLYRIPGSRRVNAFLSGLLEKTIRPVFVVHSENTVTLPHMAPGARCSRGLPLKLHSRPSPARCRFRSRNPGSRSTGRFEEPPLRPLAPGVTHGYVAVFKKRST